jgi:hypothetical protein
LIPAINHIPSGNQTWQWQNPYTGGFNWKNHPQMVDVHGFSIIAMLENRRGIFHSHENLKKKQFL